MSLGALVESLSGQSGLTLRSHESMAQHTDLRVGGRADLWIVVESESALEAVAKAAKDQGEKVHFFHETSVLVRDGGLSGAWVRLGGLARGISSSEAGVSVGALHPAAALDVALRELGHASIPYLRGRSGTVADAFNAGLLTGWVSQCRVLRGTKLADLSPEKRSEKQAIVRLLLRSSPEPNVDPVGQLCLLPEQIQALGKPGRIMEDPKQENAALLIREAGLSGVRLRGARVGEIEPNALINLGGASAEDVWLVFQMIRDRVKLHSGHQLQTSIRRIGRGRE